MSWIFPFPGCVHIGAYLLQELSKAYEQPSSKDSKIAMTYPAIPTARTRHEVSAIPPQNLRSEEKALAAYVSILSKQTAAFQRELTWIRRDIKKKGKK